MTNEKSQEIKSAIEKVLRMWANEILLNTKKFGPYETYSCAEVINAQSSVSHKLDQDEYDEIISIADFHVGRMALEASKYVKILRVSELDKDLLFKEISAREELAFM